jgi:hypothetical protein
MNDYAGIGKITGQNWTILTPDIGSANQLVGRGDSPGKGQGCFDVIGRR